MNYFSKYSINKIIYKLRYIFNTPRVIPKSTSSISGLIEVIDVGRERQLLINGETHTIIMTKGKWNEVEREYWGYMSRSPFPLIKNPRVLVCGLGGGAVVQILAKSIHPVSFTLIERDPEIVKISREYFSLNVIQDDSIIIDDATKALIKLTSSQSKFDLIIDDVFYESTRWGVEQQKDLIRLFTALLAKDGVIIFNRVIDSKEDTPKVKAFIEILLDLGFTVKSKSVRQRGLNDIIYCKLKTN